MTEVLQGPPEIYEGKGMGRVQCISTPLENEVSSAEFVLVKPLCTLALTEHHNVLDKQQRATF